MSCEMITFKFGIFCVRVVFRIFQKIIIKMISMIHFYDLKNQLYQVQDYWHWLVVLYNHPEKNKG